MGITEFPPIVYGMVMWMPSSTSPNLSQIFHYSNGGLKVVLLR